MVPGDQKLLACVPLFLALIDQVRAPLRRLRKQRSARAIITRAPTPTPAPTPILTPELDEVVLGEAVDVPVEAVVVFVEDEDIVEDEDAVEDEDVV
ncbi:hypothetical protein MMC29_000442 [Sticta canariensis]|nr:hypothetical protein [Sticta canariensis]